MFIKREWKNLDKVMLIVSFLIVCISLCIIGSATHINKGAINYDFVAKQGAAFVVDLMIILFFSRFDYAKLKKYAKPLYIINLLMLVFVGPRLGFDLIGKLVHEPVMAIARFLINR